jgi:hypothetical protein
MSKSRLVIALGCLAGGFVLSWGLSVLYGCWLPGENVCPPIIVLPAVIGIVVCAGLLLPKTPPPPAWTPPPRLPRDEG